jgi:hypothetical protein
VRLNFLPVELPICFLYDRPVSQSIRPSLYIHIIVHSAAFRSDKYTDRSLDSQSKRLLSALQPRVAMGCIAGGQPCLPIFSLLNFLLCCARTAATLRTDPNLGHRLSAADARTTHRHLGVRCVLPRRDFHHLGLWRHHAEERKLDNLCSSSEGRRYSIILASATKPNFWRPKWSVIPPK